METPELFQESSCYYNGNTVNTHEFSPEKHHSEFAIEDLLDFPTEDVGFPAVPVGGSYGGAAGDVVTETSTDSSAAVDSCKAGDSGCRSFAGDHFSNDLYVPYDAELEWLSNFVEDSFSRDQEDLQKLQLISGIKTRPDNEPETNKFQSEPINRAHNPIFNKDMMVPGKARTKRSRAAPCDWTSRLLNLPPTSSDLTDAISSASESDIPSSSIEKKTIKAPSKKKDVYDNTSLNGNGRKCLHCATDKTPQWRTGPMGPKTLCNACGVRYKSGRLVPEYRPAASPTYVLTKHSNSHRKVLELRRQKEMQNAQQQQQQQFLHHQNMMFDVSNGDDYLIHQHIGFDYRQLI